MDYFNVLMQTPVRQGGNSSNLETGIKKMPSMHTTFRKFSYLSTVFEHMIKKGMQINNPALAVCKIMRPFLPKKEKG